MLLFLSFLQTNLVTDTSSLPDLNRSQLSTRPRGVDYSPERTTHWYTDQVQSHTANMSSFPQELPPRPEGRSWKERNCPGMRTCWHFSWDAYNLKTSDMAVLLRRICMWIVLVLRTFLSVLAIIGDAYGGRIVSMIVGIILAVIGFLFIAWCLATIGEAKGRRRVLGIMVVSKRPYE